MREELIALGRIGRGGDRGDRLGEIQRRAAAEPDDEPPLTRVRFSGLRTAP